MCLFEGRAGSLAHAMFASKQQAMRFAERHAQTMGPAIVPIEWHDAIDETGFDLPVGKYRIVRVEDA